MKIGIKVRASAILFKDNKLIITKHDVPNYGVYYLIPGGGIEHGESPQEAIIREVKEECGVDVNVEKLVFYKSGYSDTDDYLDFIFLCKITNGDLKIDESEKSVKAIELISNEEDLRKIKFFPKQIIDKVFKELPDAKFLGKFKYPED
jgi:ADP-ribose pyrophosphatase YjhB (NUDIX family)